ncbi:hypothetical protein CROQUDRAFT_664236 [Cronartium quercuum f. sp. fusiforme G11]|uniref:Uncharacterized protein n=1 Tax=Cronartium quercuum f. sp. fusiforme G11 TaxID=708437 RepID=A0A9P6NCB9_9BASI|nr:hypothetical protein CROQUDRAFT_664236 [Cronartium quercuum f. sp. fusiforme G11]
MHINPFTQDSCSARGFSLKPLHFSTIPLHFTTSLLHYSTNSDPNSISIQPRF